MGLSGMFGDNDAVVDYLSSQGDLDWTITRPGQLQDGPSKGDLKAVPAMGGAVKFVDMARFNLQAAVGTDQIRAYPYVGY